MNERIRELAKEAGITTNLDTDYFVNDPDSSLKSLSNAGKWVDYFSEKFADLIVRECLEQCNVNFVGTVGSYPNAHNRGVKKCIDNIKEHFGVEE